MTWSSPWWLAGLPLLAVVTVLAREWYRRSQAAALRFAGTEILSDLLTQSRRRNKAAPVLAVAGGAVLLLGLAGPQMPLLLDQQRANVVLVMDVSGSMSATDVAPTRLSAAQAAARQFLGTLPAQWKAGLVAFSDAAYVVSAPTSDREAVARGLAGLVAGGGTATGEALDLAIDTGRAGDAQRLAEAIAVKDALERPSRSVLVLLSDGRPTAGDVPADRAAQRAASLGIPVFTIAFGTDQGVINVLDADGVLRPLQVPPDPATMQAIAGITSGRYFPALTAEDLASVYSSVSAQLERESVTVDLGPGLVLAGIIAVTAALLIAVRRRFSP